SAGSSLYANGFGTFVGSGLKSITPTIVAVFHPPQLRFSQSKISVALGIASPPPPRASACEHSGARDWRSVNGGLRGGAEVQGNLQRAAVAPRSRWPHRVRGVWVAYNCSQAHARRLRSRPY